MENYLWLWLSASSFINAKSPHFWAVIEKLQVSSWMKWRILGNTQDSSLCSEWLKGIRRTNTPYFPKYTWNEKISESAIQPMLESDYLIESFFLSLRTDRWIDDVEKYKSVLVKDYSEKIKLYEENGFLKPRENGFVLTDEWMDCYNGIITDLLEEV